MKKFLTDIFIVIVVFVGGAVVLALELLGTRILGPFYGVSLYLWSSLITVTLAALSCGYILGGIIADRNASKLVLYGFIFLSGIWVAFIPWFKSPCLLLLEPLGLRVATFLASLILFFPPLVVLGMISPYAVKLRAVQLDRLGRVAGNLYAISTIASVLSALITGFYLIPNFGIQRMMLTIGILLMLIATLGFILEKKAKIATTVLGVVVLLTFTLIQHESTIRSNCKLVNVEQSAYGELSVIDTDAGRHLLIDGGIHSLVDTTTWNSTLPYCAVMDLPKIFFSHPGTMLLIGLGGGSIVKQYSQDHWSVDAVEIDPQVVGLATRYFHLFPSECTIHVMDGRRFLQTTTGKYNIILLDAFGCSTIPFHLVTKEAFRAISSRLSDDGVFAMNIEAIGWNDPIIHDLCATIAQSFHTVIVLPIAEPPTQFGNVVIMASQHSLEPLQELKMNVDLDPDWRFGPEYQRVHSWENKFFPDIQSAHILTDDANPIDLRSEAINYASRKDLHLYFEKNKISW